MTTSPCFRIPGSKSQFIRAIVLTTCVAEPVVILHPASGEDAASALGVLDTLGFGLANDDNALTIHPNPAPSSPCLIHVGDSAALFRFLMARCAVWQGMEISVKTGRQLAARPWQTFCDTLCRMGADIRLDGSDPCNGALRIRGKRIDGGVVSIDPGQSSQVISGMLMSAPFFSQGLELCLTGVPVSRPYIDMTIAMMRAFGVGVISGPDKLVVMPKSRYVGPHLIRMESDFSSASYLLALGAVLENGVGVCGDYPSMWQGDGAIVDILRDMGASVSVEPGRIHVSRERLRGITIDMRDTPDLVPTLAFLALFADSPTSMTGIGHLRWKESDRITGIYEEFRKMGVGVWMSEASLIIEPGFRLKTAVKLDPRGDHRLAMIFLMLSKLIPGVDPGETACIRKSFPEFPAMLALILA